MSINSSLVENSSQLENAQSTDDTAIDNRNVEHQSKLEFQKNRATYILERFELDAEQFDYAWSFETLDYVNTDAYTFFVDSIDLPAGASSLSYFISKDATVVYAVYQDVDALNHCCEFVKQVDGSWQLESEQTAQDPERYSDDNPSIVQRSELGVQESQPSFVS